MIWSRIGKNVKKSEGILRTEILRRTELAGNVYLHAQTEKISGKIEPRKSQAIEFAYRIQNR